MFISNKGKERKIWSNIKKSLIVNPRKQKQEVILSTKTTNWSHSNIFFIDPTVTSLTSQKSFRMYLGENLNFNYYIKEKKSKVTKGIGWNKKL